SYAAAWQLGYADQGTALVHIEALVPGQQPNLATETALPQLTATNEGHYLQAGAFSDLDAAQRLSERLQGITTRPVFIRSTQAGNTQQPLHRVRVGPITDSHEVQRITDMMLAAGLGEPFVVND